MLKIADRIIATPTELIELKSDVRQRDHDRCRLCGCGGRGRVLPVHHIVPLADGGNDVLDNLVTTCNSCHQRAHSTDITALLMELAADPQLSPPRSPIHDVEGIRDTVIREVGGLEFAALVTEAIRYWPGSNIITLPGGITWGCAGGPTVHVVDTLRFLADMALKGKAAGRQHD